MEKIKNKFLNTIVIAGLVVLVIYLLYDKLNHREGVETNFRDSLRVLNNQIVEKEIVNRNIMEYVDSVETDNARLNSKRATIKTEWIERIVQAKSEPCDTNTINELNSLHIASDLNCDTALFNRDLIIDKLKEVISNDSVIVALKDSTINLYSNAYLDLEEKAERDKKKAFRNGFKWGFGTGFVSGFISKYFLDKKE